MKSSNGLKSVKLKGWCRFKLYRQVYISTIRTYMNEMHQRVILIQKNLCKTATQKIDKTGLNDNW